MKPATNPIKQHREFGIMIALVLVLVASWRTYKAAAHLDLTTQLLYVAALFLAVAWLLPSAFGPMYRLWMLMAAGINVVVTHVLMAIVFYAAILPLGLLYRVTAGDPLLRKFKARGDDSAWVPRTDTPRSKSSYYRQF